MEKADKSASVKTPPRRGRGRPRAEHADETILTTARSILAEDGYEAMSFKAIEQITGISRAAIYRRWPTKAHLVNEVAHGVEEHISDIVQANGLREQIRAVAARIYDQYHRPEIGAASAGLIAAYHREPALRVELHTPRELIAREDLAHIVASAQETGEIRADVDPDPLFDVIVGTIIYRTIFSSVPPGDDFVDEICAIILDGIATPRG